MTFEGFSPRQASAGIGLRHAHYSEFLKEKQPVAWLEVHAENFLNFNIEEYIENVFKKLYIILLRS